MATATSTDRPICPRCNHAVEPGDRVYSRRPDQHKDLRACQDAATNRQYRLEQAGGPTARQIRYALDLIARHANPAETQNWTRERLLAHAQTATRAEFSTTIALLAGEY